MPTLRETRCSGRHDHHELAFSAMHVHLEYENCMEVSILCGDARAVRRQADHVIAERGVRYGRLVTMPVTIDDGTAGRAQSTNTGQHAHGHVKGVG